MSGYDLHSHTVVSDGTTTPEQNVAMALAAGLDGLGVTDHDTTAGIARARAAADGTGLEIIPGTEFSAELGGTSVHVLGYWFDLDDGPLQAEMGRLRNERERRAEEIVGKFNGLGVAVEMERVRELAGDAPIGRPHIARAVVETGAADSLQEVFGTWLADGGPAYVPKYAVRPARAVELLVAAGGAAVLAHPGLYGVTTQGLDRGAIEEMVDAGLAGIEADHPDHTEQMRDRYRRIARDLDLLVTAGSDFHGGLEGGELGEARVPREVVDGLRARAAGAS